VRVLRGDRSPEPVRAVAARLVRLLPRAELVELRAAGHMLPATHPERLVSALPSWLARPVATATGATPSTAGAAAAGVHTPLRLRPA
jgi:hypothetical protein